MQKTSKLWGRRGFANFIFQCSDTFDTHSEAMHGILTDVKKSSKTKFLPEVKEVISQGANNVYGAPPPPSQHIMKRDCVID